MSRIAIVTGASSGIGEAFVRETVKEDLDKILIIARREDKLKALKEELSSDRIDILPADITTREGVESLRSYLEDNDPFVGLLINCAGMGKKGNIADRDEKCLEDTLNLNCRSLSVITRMCLPRMGEGSRVINIASSAAFLPQPGFAAYAASKAYVVSFSRALGIELLPRRIKVTTVCPGPVVTGFQALATDGGSAEFTGFRRFVAADPHKLAKASLKASLRGRKLFVYGLTQKLLHLASKIVPTYWIIRLEGAFMKPEYEKKD